MTAPLHGLLLAGGSSSRMQRDKAVLRYRGRTQLDRAFELLRAHVASAFVSVRASQAEEPTRARHPLIVDCVDGSGPIVGIRSALASKPDSAWLVLACDLPFLSDAILERLIAERDPHVLATAYASAHDALPEPLCAIWEPAAGPALGAYQSGGRMCPRKFLMTHPVHLIEPVDRRALDNVNTPDEYHDALNALDADAAPLAAADDSAPAKSVRSLDVQYFALLREQAGRSQERMHSAAATPAELYAELRARYGFTLPPEMLKVAVNNEFSPWSRTLEAGDAVVFIPPGRGRLMRFRFTGNRIDAAAARNELLDRGAGGFVAFEGWVRDHNEGREVTRLEYEAYEALAVKEGERIIAEALRRFPVKHALCIHRTGSLDLTDMAVWVGVSSAHRAEAFDACRFIIDEVKHSVPIWKKEHYGSGDSGWVNCERCAAAPSHGHSHQSHGHDDAA